MRPKASVANVKTPSPSPMSAPIRCVYRCYVAPQHTDWMLHENVMKNKCMRLYARAVGLVLVDEYDYGQPEKQDPDPAELRSCEREDKQGGEDSDRNDGLL